jgi:putative flippase GtrA
VKEKLLMVLQNKRLRRYFIMAVTIVCIELAIFQALYQLINNYIVATTLSFVIAVVLNWIGSRVLVFGASSHNPVKEFVMVFIASIVGLLIQVSVVFVSVEILLLYPFIGKSLSILFSFFWNYLFRSRIIYRV